MPNLASKIRAAQVAAWLAQPLMPLGAAEVKRAQLDSLFKDMLDYCYRKGLRDPVGNDYLVRPEMREDFYRFCHATTCSEPGTHREVKRNAARLDNVGDYDDLINDMWYDVFWPFFEHRTGDLLKHAELCDLHAFLRRHNPGLGMPTSK